MHHRPSHHRIADGSVLKHVKLDGLRVYWIPEERCPMIPYSLLASTKDLEHQIFEAIDCNDLKIQMRE